MEYKKFKAQRLFDGTRFRSGDEVLMMRTDGTVEAIVPAAEAGDDIVHLEGILTPGLINCHCHLELSHLKNVIPPHTGLIEFLCSVVTKRDFDPALIQEEIRKAELEMSTNGIVAVGDIGNTADTAAIKSQSRIRWQNFVEVLGFTDAKAQENIRHYQQVARQLEEVMQVSAVPHRTTLVPHAPYSISPNTFQLINENTAHAIISLHNQEHPAEDELYKTGGGEYLKLFRIFGIEKSPFPVTGLSSIRSVLPHFTNGQTVLLVHNTFMPEADVQWANDYAAQNGLKLVYCLCINANLYIENKVPPVEMLLKQGCTLVLGTDSYSSNWQLSIAKEMQALQEYVPALSLETILQWATSNGAKALGWADELGSFEKGKKPGLTIINTTNWTSSRVM